MIEKTLGDRMKNYEDILDYKLIPKLPLVIRLDGRAFHTLSKRLKLVKPYDIKFSDVMNATMVKVASTVQQAVVGYVQSDEITIVSRVDKNLYEDSWFGGRLQKIVSIAASAATCEFNKHKLSDSVPYEGLFDCRVTPLPNLDEVINNIIWRQNDCVKNSISATAQYYICQKFGKKTGLNKLHGLNSNQLQEILFTECGLNWSLLDDGFKNGRVAFKEPYAVETENGSCIRTRWTVSPAPVFTSSEGRMWLENVIDYHNLLGEKE